MRIIFIYFILQSFYLIKWEGYTKKFNTLEPLENLDECDELLNEYENKQAREIQSEYFVLIYSNL